MQPFEGDGPRRQVSRAGGFEPLWSRDGRGLLFISSDGVMSVPASAGSFGTPRLVAAGRFVASQNGNTNYDIARAAGWPDSRLEIPDDLRFQIPDSRFTDDNLTDLRRGGRRRA